MFSASITGDSDRSQFSLTTPYSPGPLPRPHISKQTPDYSTFAPSATIGNTSEPHSLHTSHGKQIRFEIPFNSPPGLRTETITYRPPTPYPKVEIKKTEQTHSISSKNKVAPESFPSLEPNISIFVPLQNPPQPEAFQTNAKSSAPSLSPSPDIDHPGTAPYTTQQSQLPFGINPYPQGATERFKPPEPLNMAQIHVDSFMDLNNQLATKEDIIISLKIQNAVTKTKLKALKREKESMESTVAKIMDSLVNGLTKMPSACSADPAAIAELRKEIDTLRMDNRGLREENKNLRESCRALREETQFAEIGKGHNNGDDSGFVGENLGSTFGSRQLIGSWGDEAVGEEGGAATNLFEVMYNPTTSGSSAKADVGIHTLEEILDSHHDLSPGSSMSISSSVKPLSEVNLDKGDGEDLLLALDDRNIDEQLAEHSSSLTNFIGLPKPGVLKVGFNPENSFRGAEYDYTKLPPSGPRGAPAGPILPRTRCMQTYNRFGLSQEEIEAQKMNLGVFDSREERDNALNEHARAARQCIKRGEPEKTLPGMLRFGVVYVPREGEFGFLRTVLIENLPDDIHLRDVLAQVRGGDVLSATLVDTMPVTGFKSARVVFKTEEAAKRYVAYTGEQPISFTWKENGKETVVLADVILIQTPTFPVAGKNKHWLYPACTRCLRVPNFPSSTSLSELEKLIVKPWPGNVSREDSLLEIWLDEKNDLHMQFSSVEMAESAWYILRQLGAEYICEADPCASSLEQLRLPVQPRASMYPANRKGSSVEAGQTTDVEERRPLTTLRSQNVEIPSLNGQNIKGSKWADEVEEEEVSFAGNDSVSVIQCDRSQQTTFSPLATAPPNNPNGSVVPSVSDFTEAVSKDDNTNHVTTDLKDPLLRELYQECHHGVEDLHYEEPVNTGLSASRWADPPPQLPFTYAFKNPHKAERTMFLDGTSDAASTEPLKYASPHINLDALIASRSASLASASTQSQPSITVIPSVPAVQEYFLNARKEIYDIAAATHKGGLTQSSSLSERPVSPKGKGRADVGINPDEISLEDL